MTSTNSPSFSGSPVTSMAKPSVPESTTRPPKISASLRTAVRLSCGGPDAQQNEFPDDGGALGEVVGLQHVDQLVHLLDDLGALEGIDVHHDGHAGEFGVQRAGHGEALNVVAALGQQAGDAHRAPGLFSSSREMICSIWKSFKCTADRPEACPTRPGTATGCGGPSTISLMAPPAGTIG